MKKLATILCLSALATAVYAQGTVNFANGSYSLVRTNSSAIAGGNAGTTSPALGGFVYGLFTASSTITTIGSAYDLLTPEWHFTGLYGTNSAAATGGRFNGGAGVVVPQFWTPGETNSYVVLGWSANMGSTWSEVQAAMAGGSYRSNVYNLPGASLNLDGRAFLGVSARGFGMAGGGTAGLPAFSLFGLTPVAAGTPIGTGWDLSVVQVPEPGTFALAGLGAAALLIFRRRK